MSQLEEGVDFYYNEQGFMVLKEEYLRARGFCCESACKHCPYHSWGDSKAQVSKSSGSTGESDSN